MNKYLIFYSLVFSVTQKGVLESSHCQPHCAAYITPQITKFETKGCRTGLIPRPKQIPHFLFFSHTKERRYTEDIWERIVEDRQNSHLLRLHSANGKRSTGADSWWDDAYRGKPRYPEKTYPTANFSMTNPKMNGLESNPDLRGQCPQTWRQDGGRNGRMMDRT